MRCLLLGFLLSGCLSLVAHVWGDEVAKKNWMQHGLGTTGRTALVTHLQNSVTDGSIPGGSLLLVHQGEIVFRQGFGYGHVRRQQPFTADTPFRVASISKSIIATLMVKLDNENKIDLDQSIDVYLPECKSLRLGSGETLMRMPTLAECLKHTAGFASDYEQGGRPWLALTGKGLTLKQVVSREMAIPMRGNPGEKFAYSGIGYDVVGRIIEVVMNQPLNDVLKNELLSPLGIEHTTYYPDSATIQAIPSFYWRWRSDGGLRRRLDERFVPEGEYVSVGGGIVSTLDDLAKLMMMHRNGGEFESEQLVETSALQRMYERHSPGSYYGLGWTLGPMAEDGLATWIFHSGSSGTMWWWDREHDVIGVFATQHHFSDGKKIAGSEKLIPQDAASWQAATKAKYIDPVFGWRTTSQQK